MLPEAIQNYYQQPGYATGEFIVPEGHYLRWVITVITVSTADSGGPEQNLVGKAVFKWMSFEFSEDANSWLPG